MIAPLGDLARTTIVGPMGQSGQPGLPHYDDFIQPWMEGRGVPLLFTREAIDHHVASRLMLTP
jgi:penicillin amidase